ncbi:hypothetical protein LTR08_008267 [Meristemomyces frigidus]|nr:hypothetical protein LTR08_008267 [Meristemomyces frigidus]
MRKAVDEHLTYAVDDRGKRTLGRPEEVVVESDDQHMRSGDPPIDIPTSADDDVEYVYESSDGEEPLEYASEVESLDGDGDSGAADPDLGQEDDTPDDGNTEYHAFSYRVLPEDEEARKTSQQNGESNMPWHRIPPAGINLPVTMEARDQMFPLYYPTDRDDASEHGSDSSYKQRHESGTHDESHDRLMHMHCGKLGYHADDENDVEHIAGPSCEASDGYSGHKLSAEEARGCTTLQCLVRKPPATAPLRYQPEPEDEDFEREGGFFLSGLSDHMPSRDMDYPTVYPARHGCEDPQAENDVWEAQGAEEYAMPFHPSCLEVYKRACRLRTGGVDIEGLTGWWMLDAAGYDLFHRFDRDPDVGRCEDQFWQHHAGTEYLAANPLFVPTLPRILEQAQSSQGDSFDPRAGAFDLTDQHQHALASPDAFAALPHELRLLTLSYLPSRDIASLRLASPTFRQLPITLFRDLLQREMPWLWELWCSTPYSPWACATATDLATSNKRFEDSAQAAHDYVRIVIQELPELEAQITRAPAGYQLKFDFEAHRAFHNAANTPATLPRDKTNWYTLYTLLTRHLRRGELKGLQNRARIWRGCEEILQRVGRYREEGVLPIEDVGAMMRELQKRRAKVADEQARGREMIANGAVQ